MRARGLHTAFLATQAKAPVSMARVDRAARVEYAKLDRTLTEAEVRGWA